MEEIKKDNFEDNHEFLAEELMVPNVDKADSSRINMLTNHLRQCVVLKDGEFPRVFTNFENRVGKYSSSFRKSDRDWTVVGKIPKNDLNTTYVVRDKEGFYDVIEVVRSVRTTEKYGYKIEDQLSEKEVGDEIDEGELMYKSTSYIDDDLNFSYGTNLKSIYLPYENLTFEDAIVMTESGAEKLKYYQVDEVTININNNDALLNLFGDEEEYRTFPDIGEEFENILAARRRINYVSIGYDFASSNLFDINWDTDTVFYSDGIVADIDVFSNTPREELEKFYYNEQILEYLEKNKKYREKLHRMLHDIVESNSEDSYSDDLAYAYKRAREVLDGDVSWRNNNSEFDNVVIRVKVLKEVKLNVGSKLTGRYGNKGVVSKIVPDDEVPQTEDGETPDVILNPLGIINRMNPAQLYEQEINMISNQILERVKDMEDLYDKAEYLCEYIGHVNERQANEMIDFINNSTYEEMEEFVEEIEREGIYIHQPPFHDNITFDKLKFLYDKYEIEPYDFEEIENPLVMGELYFMRLKHEPGSKFSARSSSYLNLKEIPSKSTKYKENEQLYSKTPIKVGEMEVSNLFLCSDVDEVTRFLRQYSSNKEDRQRLIKSLLTENIFNLDRIEPTETSPITKIILETYLKCMGLKLD